MNLATQLITLPGVPGGTWPITDNARASEQFMIDNEHPTCAMEQDELWGSLGPYSNVETPPVGMQGVDDPYWPAFGPFHEDEFINMLGPEYYPSLVGMGAAPPPETITAPPVEQIKQSTIYLVGGIALVAIIGSIGLWAWKAGEK
jgi:hypothetical protein